MIRVKVCGICDATSAMLAANAGADLLGFHFCSSPRRVTPEDAKRIVDAIDVRPALVGVFIDQPEDEVRQTAEFVGLDMVQLHGSERPGFDAGFPLIKALKVKDGEIPDATGWPDPLMLDSWSPDQRGGTGRTWDWSAAKDLLRTRHVFIAGGLQPGNVGEVVRELAPYGVDVSSGVESTVRVKDPEKVRAFIHAVRLAEVSR